MADLRAITSIGGNMAWHTGNLRFEVQGDTLRYRGFKIFTENDFPTPQELNLYSKEESDARFAPIHPAGYVKKDGDNMSGALGVVNTLTVTGAVPGVKLVQSGDGKQWHLTSQNGSLSIGEDTSTNYRMIMTPSGDAIQLNFDEIRLKGGAAFRALGDNWLRINDTKQFTNGVNFGTSPIVGLGSLTIGSNSTAGLYVTSSAFNWKGSPVLTENNWSPLDARFVKKAGDSMTGDLFTTGLSVPAMNGYLQRKRHFPTVGGGSYNSGTSSEVGMIKIKIPGGFRATMISFWVDVYRYNSNDTMSFFVSGYVYTTGSWVNASASQVGGSAQLPVTFGKDAEGNPIVAIGSAGSNHSYPQVLVRDVQAGYSGGNNPDIYRNGWGIEVSATALAETHGTVAKPAMYSDRIKPTPADIGALSLAGGTVSGGVIIEDDDPTPLRIKRTNATDNISIAFIGSNNVPTYVGINQQGRLAYHSAQNLSAAGSELVYSTGFKPTPAEIGAVNKAGDTMTGNLTAPEFRATGNIVIRRGDNFLALDSGNSAYLASATGAILGLLDGGTVPRFKNAGGTWYELYHAGNLSLSTLGGMPITGGNFTGRIGAPVFPSSWINGIKNPTYNVYGSGGASSYAAWMTGRTGSDGAFSFGTLGETFYVRYATKAQWDGNVNSPTQVLAISSSGVIIGNGNGLTNLNAGSLVGTIPTGNLSGAYAIDITGNAKTANSATVADRVTPRTSTSSTFYNINWVSGDNSTIYHSNGKVQIRPSDGYLSAGYMRGLSGVYDGSQRVFSANNRPTWNDITGKPTIDVEPWNVFYNNINVPIRLYAIPTAARNAMASGKNVMFRVGVRNGRDFGTRDVMFHASMWNLGSQAQINSVVEGLSFFWIHNGNSTWGSEANYFVSEHTRTVYLAWKIVT